MSSRFHDECPPPRYDDDDSQWCTVIVILGIAVAAIVLGTLIYLSLSQGTNP